MASHQLSRREFLTRMSSILSPFVIPASLLPQASSFTPFIVDTHEDLGWNIVNYQRDYTLSALTTRKDETTTLEAVAGHCMLGLPEWLAGHVGLIHGAIFVIPAELATSKLQIARYSTPAEAYFWGQKMLEGIESLIARSNSRMTLVKNREDLQAVLNTWQLSSPEEKRQVGVILQMEGADPIESPDQLAAWYARGLRTIGLSWGKTRYAGGNFGSAGLSDLGIQLLQEMNRLGMIFDTAHIAERAYWDAVKVWSGTFICSHGMPHYFLPTERGLTDDQIKVMAQRDGIMGIGLYDGFYEKHRVSNQGVTVKDVANAVDYVCQLIGDTAHVAIGSDCDGGFGSEFAPKGIDTIADLPLIGNALSQMGYTPTQVGAILNGNWLRMFDQMLPAATAM